MKKIILVSILVTSFFNFVKADPFDALKDIADGLDKAIQGDQKKEKKKDKKEKKEDNNIENNSQSNQLTEDKKIDDSNQNLSNADEEWNKILKQANETSKQTKEKGLSFASKAKTKFELNAIKDEMTGKVSYSAFAITQIKGGGSVETKVYCNGKNLMMENTVHGAEPVIIRENYGGTKSFYFSQGRIRFNEKVQDYKFSRSEDFTNVFIETIAKNLSAESNNGLTSEESYALNVDEKWIAVSSFPFFVLKHQVPQSPKIKGCENSAYWEDCSDRATVRSVKKAELYDILFEIKTNKGGVMIDANPYQKAISEVIKTCK